MQQGKEQTQPFNVIADLSSIHQKPQHSQFDISICAPYWNIYLASSPPPSLNINMPFHKLLWLFYQATSEQYFPKIFYLQTQSNCAIASINYPRLLNLLKNRNDQLANVLFQVFQNISLDPANVITAFTLILHHFLKAQLKLFVVIEDFPTIQMVQIKAHMVQRLVCFKAVVLKVNQIRLMTNSIHFQCLQCKTIFQHFLTEGIYSTPIKCKADKKKCQSKSFIALKDMVRSIFIQRAKVQETDSQGRVPRQIICEFRENLVGKVITGETVTITGILKTQANQERDRKAQGIFSPFLVVNFIKQKLNPTDKYNMEVITKMRSNKRLFFSLIKSFCPTIYGHQIVKAGLILSLIGGSCRSLAEESTFRQSSHTLLLGDPGLGKSQLLKFAVELLPHSVYVNATAVSNSGMTVTVNKDNNQQSLEAGALILADGGICAIDEFDKISDSSCLLQVMEQQTVSIAKAGIICQLKCRVGIVASANPLQGSYNKGKSFKQNTKISNAILSRFDLIFLLVDKPDPNRDRKLSEHIMKIHNQNRKKKPNVDNLAKQRSTKTDYLTLSDQYAHEVQQDAESYTLEEMKQYFVFIRNEIHPTLTMEAAEVLKGFYIALRENNPSNSFQITSRQLQSLIRLSMARARVEGRCYVTQIDAIEITNLMQESLFDSFQQFGYNINTLNQQVKRAKVPNKKNSELSLPKQRNLFVQQLNELGASKQQNLWDWSQLVKVAKDMELNIGDFHIFIERLNQEGILLQRGPKKYSFQSTFL